MNINIEELSLKILHAYPRYSEVMAYNIAQELLKNAPASLEPAIRAWIDGKPLPENTEEKYSVSNILKLRNSSDYVDAFRLYIAYSQNPAVGESLICHPARMLHSSV